MVQFRKLLNAQRKLISKYMVLYGIPELPIDIDEGDNQDFLRHLFSAYVEELVEVWNSYTELLNHVKNNRLTQSERQASIKAISLELADCLHFQLEILLYSNLDEETFADHIHKLAKHSNFELNEEDGLLTQINKLSNFHLIEEGLKPMNVTFYPIATNDEYKGGSKLSNTYYQTLPILYWDLVTALMTAQNHLKNKKWKVNKVQTNIQGYTECIHQATYIFFALGFALGNTEETFIKNYLTKNKINHKRINSKNY